MKKPDLNDLHLPSTFRFCISTAAHQVEGNNIHSDWWKFEQEPGRIKLGHTSEHATDAWGHLDEDLHHLKSIGVDTYRYSIEWAKIEPKEGEFDETELNRYLNLIDRLSEIQIESMLTLYHFPLPLWVAEKGGWEWDGIAKAFESFTRYVVPKIGSKVKVWITLNEPMTIIAGAYLTNVFPPAIADPSRIGLPMANMLRAHALSYHAIHEILDTPQFKPIAGLAHHLRAFDPRNPKSFIDRWLTHKFDSIFNWAIPTALQTGKLQFTLPFVAKANFNIPEAIDTQDFFGLNYYSRDLIHFSLKPPFLHRSIPENAKVTDLEWEIYPDGIGRLISDITHRFRGMPIWITENGLADESDLKRPSFIFDHLKVIEKSINQGAPVVGYTHWTFSDNFEWAEGYTAKFGLYALEPHTLKRIPRSSVQFFTDLIRKVKTS